MINTPDARFSGRSVFSACLVKHLFPDPHPMPSFTLSFSLTHSPSRNRTQQQDLVAHKPDHLMTGISCFTAAASVIVAKRRTLTSAPEAEADVKFIKVAEKQSDPLLHNMIVAK